MAWKTERREAELDPVRRAIEQEPISLGFLVEETELVPNPQWNEPPLPTLSRDGKLVRERRSEPSESGEQ